MKRKIKDKIKMLLSSFGMRRLSVAPVEALSPALLVGPVEPEGTNQMLSVPSLIFFW